jgi:hypothetical protein
VAADTYARADSMGEGTSSQLVQLSRNIPEEAPRAEVGIPRRLIDMYGAK